MSEGENDSDFAAFEAKVNEAEAPAEVAEVIEAEKPLEEGAEVEERTAEEESAEEAVEGDEKPEEKPKQKPSDRIRELTKKNRESERREEALIARLEALENRLPAEKTNVTPASEDTAPNPSDLEKYPLGSLDDRYIEDMIEHVASKKVADHLESARQREAEKAQQAQAEQQQALLLQQAETVASRGAELFDDFEEKVVIPAMQGKFDLTQTTFEAIAEVDNGAQILRALATDTAEASRVAKLSPFQQLKYVAAKDAEFAGKGTAHVRKLPGAPVPPSANIKGAGTRSSFSPETASFADFEKQVTARR